jgi:hypothetical protein
MPLYNKAGERFDLTAQLGGLTAPGEIAEWPVWVHCGEQSYPGRLTAIRKSQAAIRQAEARIRDKEQRGKKVGSLGHLCAEYVLVFTTLTAEEASAEEVLETYRLRWQIELNFKRLKSIAELGHLPKYDDRSSRAWLYGKLFIALLTEKMVRVANTISPWGYTAKATENIQQVV